MVVIPRLRIHYHDSEYQDALDDLRLAVEMGWLSKQDADEVAQDIVRFCVDREEVKG